jgi:hypothetical protein
MAEITHPYHPFSGQKFRILKTRQVAGEETLILEGTYRGTFAVLREWTDRAAPTKYVIPSGPPPVLNFVCLLQLADLVETLHEEKDKKGVDQ